MPVDTAPATERGTRDTGGDHYRYPGSPPFQDSELHRRLFKGRAKEADRILHSILSSDLFLLYSVSGLGKTSLLNAGVMHGLRSRGYWPVSVRLNDINKPPAEQIREQIEQAAATDPGIEVLRSPDAPKDADTSRSLWELLTSIEAWRGNELEEIVLILDQFEELFTLEWDEDQQKAFIADFGEVARGHRTPKSSSSRTFQPAPNVKIVLAMREDALGELEALSADVPHIMANRFRLGPLDPIQAEHAIREPAGLDDPRLGSQRFEYTADAAQELLSFLRTKTLDGSTIQTAAIDPSQLQIVCQFVERNIVPKKAANLPADSVVEIDAVDLGGTEGLNRILSDFYRRTIESFPGRAQVAVRDLCENGLINRNQRRLSLEQGEVETSHKVSPEMLQQLVDARLLRSEPRVGSVYYELAHDTLVRPILEYRDWHRRKRNMRRLRWIGVAIGIGLIAIVVGVFMISASQPDLEAQASATQAAALAAEAAAEADLTADVAAEAAAEAERTADVAAEEARIAAEERQEAVAALAQAQAAAETAQVKEAAVRAQPPADLRSAGADVEIGEAAAGAAQAAAEEAQAAASAAEVAAGQAQAAAAAVQRAVDVAAQTAQVEVAQAAAEEARVAADAAGAALAAAQAADDAAGAALAAAQAAADAAGAALAAAQAPEEEAQAAADAARAADDAAGAALLAAEAADAAAQAADVAAAAQAADVAAAEAADAAAQAADVAAAHAADVAAAEEAAEEAAAEVVAAEEAAGKAQAAAGEAQAAADEAQAAANEAATSAEDARQSAQADLLPRIELEKGAVSGRYDWYKVTLSGYDAGALVTLTCRSTANPTGFYETTLTMDENGSESVDELCFSLPNQEHWVTGGGVESNRLNW